MPASDDGLLEESNRGGGGVAIRFPGSWPSLRYDATDKPSFYRARVLVSQNAKAVDFLISSPHEELWIEIKDFRGNPANIQPRLSAEPTEAEKQAKKLLDQNASFEGLVVRRGEPWLGAEVAAKVRDTVLGLAAALRAEDAVLIPFARNVMEKRRIRVVFVLELEDRPDDFKRLAARLQDAIGSQLRLLDEVEVSVTNGAIGSGDPEWRIETTPTEPTPSRNERSGRGGAAGRGKPRSGGRR